jgi:hypothetical protein
VNVSESLAEFPGVEGTYGSAIVLVQTTVLSGAIARTVIDRPSPASGSTATA